MATENTSAEALIHAAAAHRNECEAFMMAGDATTAGIYAAASIANSQLALAVLELEAGARSAARDERFLSTLEAMRMYFDPPRAVVDWQEMTPTDQEPGPKPGNGSGV